MHEYSVSGHPREKIIFWVAFISIALGPFLMDEVINAYTFVTGKTLSLTIAVSVVFTAIYFLFNKYLWKVKFFGKVFSFPNLSGTWVCKGSTLNSDGEIEFSWDGKVRIEQTWDKVLITLITDKSKSQSLSVVGGVCHVPTVGYKLSYSYANVPSIDQVALDRHEGFCQLTFSEDMTSAQGHYFNGQGRFTFGKMILNRE